MKTFKQFFIGSNYLFFMLLPAISIFVSCSKYLEKKSNDTLIIPSALSDLQALLDHSGIMNQGTSCYGEVSSDEYFVPLTKFNALSEGDRKRYTWQYYFQQGAPSNWARCYQPIYNTNIALDFIDNIPRTNANAVQWDNVMGSALFFRSYYFLCLVWDYAKAYDNTTANKDLGIVLRLTSDPTIPSTRATNQACYEQIIKDTRAAAALLPDYPQHVFRPSKGAAYGLLARCYLSMRDYKEALLYADSALQLNSQLMDLNGDADIPSGISTGFGYTFKQFNKETVFYSEINTYLPYYITTLSARIDTLLYNSYDSTDLRKSAYFYTDPVSGGGYMQFKGSYTQYIRCFSGIAVDELFLTRAECYIRMGNVQAGLNDLNTVLSKRYKAGYYQPYSSLSEQDALKLILAERKKELVMRGMRWPDLKRLNKEGAGIVLKRVIGDSTYTLLPNANFYALPLPEDIINITGMPQNDL